MCYIFGKPSGEGPQRQCFWVSDMQIHKYKDKYKHNTQIQFRWKLSKVCYSFGMIMVQGSQKLICWVSDMQIDNTNTLIQIYKYKIHFWWILPIDPAYAIFLEWLWASVYNRYSVPPPSRTWFRPEIQNFTLIPQVLAWYIQYQHLSSSEI